MFYFDPRTDLYFCPVPSRTGKRYSLQMHESSYIWIGGTRPLWKTPEAALQDKNVRKLKRRLAGLFYYYLESMGYTQWEIEEKYGIYRV